MLDFSAAAALASPPLVHQCRTSTSPAWADTQASAITFLSSQGPLAFALANHADADGGPLAAYLPHAAMAGILFVVAQIPPQRLMRLAVPLYVLGVILLLAVEFFGITKKGATRWLNVGIVIQPSEMLKIAVPLMLAWWFQRREGQLRTPDFLAAAILLAIPVGLIMKQPDLGTAILVASAGLFVIFFAGLSWKLIVPLIVTGAVAITALVILGIRDKESFPLIFYRTDCADMALCEEDIDPAFVAEERAVVATQTSAAADPGQPRSARRAAPRSA